MVYREVAGKLSILSFFFMSAFGTLNTRGPFSYEHPQLDKDSDSLPIMKPIEQVPIPGSNNIVHLISNYYLNPKPYTLHPTP